MPNAFDITTASTTVQIDDATRKGVASYTVKNTCGRPLRGEAKLETNQPQILEPGKEWIKIDNSTFRDFSTDGTEQFTVQIGVPMQAPAGTYGFWLKMVGIENPDEMTDIGPNIDFSVKELPKPVPWWKKLKWWVWVIAGVVLLLIIGLILFLVLTPRTPATFSANILQDTSFTNVPTPGTDLGSAQFLILLLQPSNPTSATVVALQPDVSLPHSRVSIRNATLRIRVATLAPAPNPLRISASRALSGWNETPGGATPNCDTQQVTTVPVAVGTTDLEIDVTEIYKKLRKDGDTNFGICLTSPDSQYGILFLSSEHSDVNQRPSLFVDYRH